MILNRNIKLLREKGPSFLQSLGFVVQGPDWYGLNLRGGAMSFIILKQDNPTQLYMVWLETWFGEPYIKLIETINTVPKVG